ncbi:endonuclease VIII [Alkalicoccus halolimnae]|uniref:DNA-(apurinic or apyrimidinic site) lyase n=1 Tax=Alkalicoccus halolimnae TaxID=1667239 RepID=A0A5C7FL21_9BACI|nr:endonuclease VIII [Alkalicoccus halolimnae]TXF86076.1 endonuclease VIII [Alkalicoccus halolimnae]
MPEGPEIRKAADQVEKAVKGRPALDVHFGLERLEGYEDVLRGAVVTGVDTKGKAMLTRFDNGYTVYSHNQLYGKWIIRSAYNYPKTNRQLRFAIHNEKKSALLYSASEIEVLPDEEVRDHPFIVKVGPDILSEKVTPGMLYDRFQEKRFFRRKWASLLLDQGFAAGIGNYLRSEILFSAGINPSARPVDTSEKKLKKASEATVNLMKQSYSHNGITNDLTLAEKLRKQGKSRNQYRHWVFGREGESCRICGTPVLKIQAASRRLYYCEECQKTS